MLVFAPPLDFKSISVSSSKLFKIRRPYLICKTFGFSHGDTFNNYICIILIPISCRCLSQLGNLPVAIHPPDPGAVCRVLLVEQGDQLVSLVREEHLTRDLISWTSSQSYIHLTVWQSVRFLYLCRFIGCRLLFPFFQQVPPGINLVLHVCRYEHPASTYFYPNTLWAELGFILDLTSSVSLLAAALSSALRPATSLEMLVRRSLGRLRRQPSIRASPRSEVS